MTFVDRVTELLKERGTSKKQMLIDCSMGKNSFVTWKNGVVPNSSTLTVLSNYFGVTVDYLLGKTDERTVPDKKLEGLDFALSGEIKTLTENEKQDLLDYIRFKKQQKEERDK